MVPLRLCCKSLDSRGIEDNGQRWRPRVAFNAWQNMGLMSFQTVLWKDIGPFVVIVREETANILNCDMPLIDEENMLLWIIARILRCLLHVASYEGYLNWVTSILVSRSAPTSVYYSFLWVLHQNWEQKAWNVMDPFVKGTWRLTQSHKPCNRRWQFL